MSFVLQILITFRNFNDICFLYFFFLPWAVNFPVLVKAFGKISTGFQERKKRQESFPAHSAVCLDEWLAFNVMGIKDNFGVINGPTYRHPLFQQHNKSWAATGLITPFLKPNPRGPCVKKKIRWRGVGWGSGVVGVRYSIDYKVPLKIKGGGTYRHPSGQDWRRNNDLPVHHK